MDVFMKEFQHLKIQLEEIQSATDNFSENNIIGHGGFGNVYKGLIPRKGQNVVAIKRLNPLYGQGNTEFWREITMLSRYTHENLISLVGFCDEGGEKIVVYEHAHHGSLDCHLSSPLLTWIQRIKICLEAAQGLSYLHDDHGTQQRVLHRDIKSSNILLDENWKAKVSDMGLSKIGPSNQLHTAIITHVVGTYGYLDPLYMESGILSKESDIYSFGVVLFEVLCGRLCYEKYSGQHKILVHSWKQSYKQNNLVDIIFQDLAQPIDTDCLEIFSDIAYQCLQISRDKRPKMSDVVEKLKSALDSQQNAVRLGKEWLEFYEDITRTAVPPLKYRSKKELSLLLSDGVLVNGGKTWFSFDNNETHCEMISIEEGRLIESPFTFKMYYSSFGNFYDKVPVKRGKIRAPVRAQFLSLLIPYRVNLVFKADYITKEIQDVSSNLKYRLVGETKNLITHLAVRREDGRMEAELYQFISDTRTIDLHIEFELSFPAPSEMVLEGIEFRPLEKAKHQVLEHEKVEDTQHLSDLDTDWERILPNDYQEIIEWSEFPIRWTTKKELYDELCKGFLMNNGEEWFSLNKNGKKCHMVSAKNACVPIGITRMLHRESRFREVVVPFWSFLIESEIRSEVLSPETTYGTYLVYQLPENHSGFEDPVCVIGYHLPSADFWYIYLLTPQIPVIRRKADENAQNPLNNPKLLKCFPQQRSDGWMEVQIWEFHTGTTTKMIPLSFKLVSDFRIKELLVLGIEFKPI